jgi:multiple sugar transport system substrate-binding protein
MDAHGTQMAGGAAQGMTRRRAALAAGPAGAAAGGALAAACGVPGAGGGAAAQPTVGPTTLTFMHWWVPPAAFGVAMEQALQRWAAKGTPISVDSQPIPAGDTVAKYTNLLAAGTPADAVFIQPFNFAPLHTRGAWMNLDPYVKRDAREVNLPDLYPEPLVRVTRDGKLYGFPTDINVSILLYNKNLLDAAGVAPPDDTTTWESLLQSAQRLTRGEGAERQWGTHFVSDWEVPVWANGGEVLNKEETLCLLDQPAAYETVQWLADLRHRHRVAPTPDDLRQQGEQDLFASGRVALWPAQSGALSAVKGRNPSFVWGAALVPRGKAARKGYMRGGNIAMMNGTRAPEAAWQFIKYMNSPEVHTLWAHPGALMPPRKSVADSGAFVQPPPPLDMKKVVESVPAARTPHFIPEWVDMNRLVTEHLGPVWGTGQRAARDACLELKRQLDQLLAPRRK